MNGHDLVFTVGGALLALSLIPSLRNRISVPLWSAALATLVVGAFTINYLTMQYWLSAFVAGVQTGLWALVGIRTLRAPTRVIRSAKIIVQRTENTPNV